MDWILELMLNVLIAGAIVVAAFYLSGKLAGYVREIGLKYKTLDETLFAFLASLTRYAVMVLAAIFVLDRFGIQTTSIITLLGAAGLAIGLAMQGTLSNIASGVLLLALRPFRTGDFVEAGGLTGTVVGITLFTTELRTVDNAQIIIPNTQVLSGTITNFSYHATRRCDLVFGVSYDSDLKKAEETILAIVEADPRCHATPEPFLKVTNLGDFSVDFTLRVWTDNDSLWDLKFDLIRAVKEAFDREGIDIPFPTAIQIEHQAAPVVEKKPAPRRRAPAKKPS